LKKKNIFLTKNNTPVEDTLQIKQNIVVSDTINIKKEPNLFNTKMDKIFKKVQSRLFFKAAVKNPTVSQSPKSKIPILTKIKRESPNDSVCDKRRLLKISNF